MTATTLTVETTVTGPIVARLYEAYLTAFAPLATTAAALQLLDADGFAAELADPRVDKYVVRDENGEIVGLTTLTADLSAVPWISAEFYAARYPEHAATGRLFYLGFTLVVPGREQDAVAEPIFAEVLGRLRAARAVCGFDVCGRQDDVHHLRAAVARSAQLQAA